MCVSLETTINAEFLRHQHPAESAKTPPEVAAWYSESFARNSTSSRNLKAITS